MLLRKSKDYILIKSIKCSRLDQTKFTLLKHNTMVMDVYTSVMPKPLGSIYILEKFLDSDKYEPRTLLGIFDELETALHSLDLTYKYRSSNMKKDDFLCVTRIQKNTLVLKRTLMARWECSGEQKPNGILMGELELCSGLRTHDIEH